MSDDTDSETSLGVTDDWRRGSAVISRRGFLAAGAAASAASLVGCLGGGGDGSTPTTTGDEPEPPWTTDDLAAQVEEGTTLTIYSGAGERNTWESFVEVLNDEFGVGLEPNVVTAGGTEISQRFIQERQADEDTADLCTAFPDIRNQIYEDGESVAQDYFEWDIDQKFWFSEELEDYFTTKWGASLYNGGASLVMPVNEQIFEEQGLEIPSTYNDLLDDQYEGLSMGALTDPVSDQLGWVIGYHAAQTDMEPMEWIETFMDHFEVSGYNSHSNAGRSVAEGNEAFMVYNFPWTIAELVTNDEFSLVANFTQPTKWQTAEGLSYINKNAPHPWAARFALSAALEPPVQKRLINDVPAITIARTELDLSGIDIGPYAQQRLEAELDPVDFWENEEYTQTGLEAIESDAYKI